MIVSGRISFLNWFLSAAICALAWMLSACGGANTRSAQAGTEPQAVPVAIQTAEKRDMPFFLTGLGNVTAFNTVAVKSRIDGQIVKIAFTEGQLVKHGDLLIQIDPRPYQVALEQAQANLVRDQAQLKNAKADYDRYQGLYKAGVIPEQQFVTQAALVGQLEGTLQADQAAIDSAKLNLVYTNITAPVDGRVGLRQVDIGNMVHATDTNPLVVLTQLQPIAVVFTLPEDVLPNVAKHMRGGTLKVEAYSRDDATKLATGKLLTIDNQIDTTTGTGKLKAIFENSDNALWPNQFVNAHLLLETRKNTTVIPAAAVARGPQGTYVFVVKSDKTVEVQPVKVAFTEGVLAAIESGISPGEQVVTDGQDKLQKGSLVETHVGSGSSAARVSPATGTMGQ